ncbi:hypothetical protein GX48_02425 [Paracoccidioides brasiliensis]|nr:hypothetical protein GX48_02425 [Paracoccidioides brasiliensis]
MSSSEAASTWDFTPVINLIYSFSNNSQPTSLTEQATIAPSLSFPDHNTGRDGCQPLGDFGPLWDLLSGGRPPDANNATDNIQLASQSANLSQEKCHLRPHDASEQEVLAGATGNTTDTPKVRILLQKRVVENIKKKPRIRPSIFPLTKVDDDDKIPPGPNLRPAIPLSILRNPNPAVLNEAISTPLPPTTPPCYNKLSSPKSGRCIIEPILEGTPAEKRLDLISMLSTRFPKERDYLLKLQVSNLTVYEPNLHPAGVHVFVDMSNISVGFHDCIKLARDVPTSSRIPRIPLSFHNFSIILERGRSTSKRVLVGSDRFAAVDEAEAIGYEINILERVQKAKDFSRKKSSGGNGNARNNGTRSIAQGQSSGSETNAGPRQERWVEQGVDEILHLKILESIVDSEAPSTMVLATGDAAEAEYSDGFLKMVGRALQKGWGVELVSFSTTISRAYKRKEFRSQWGAQFRVIRLDEYVEHLLDA